MRARRSRTSRSLPCLHLHRIHPPRSKNKQRRCRWNKGIAERGRWNIIIQTSLITPWSMEISSLRGGLDSWVFSFDRLLLANASSIRVLFEHLLPMITRPVELSAFSWETIGELMILGNSLTVSRQPSICPHLPSFAPHTSQCRSCHLPPHFSSLSCILFPSIPHTVRRQKVRRVGGVRRLMHTGRLYGKVKEKRGGIGACKQRDWPVDHVFGRLKLKITGECGSCCNSKL